MRRTGILGWAARGALALCLVPMSACLKDDSGSGSSSVGAGVNTPLVWQDQSTAGTGATGDTPLSDVYIDSTTVTPAGAGAILPSIDEITYGFPVVYIAGNNHPLMTQSSAAAVVNPEDQLLTLINNHRLQTLGQNQGGGGGVLPGGGGQQINIVVTAIPPSGKLRKNARAHCKHWGRYHTGFMLTNPAPEGDSVNAGGVTPTGRLRKSNVTVSSVGEEIWFGPGVDTAQNTFNAMLQGNSPVLTTTAYTYIGIGHWPQGPSSFYWSFILATGVNPVN